jgi:SynChlorMet cassette protein ScmC
VDAGNGDAAKARFLPGLPVDVPAGLWRGEGRAGMLLLRHPQGPDIFCGFYPDTKPVGEKIRRPLVPILGEAIMVGTLPIHGALVERRGVGVILAGRSGAGKTTCCKRLPAGWQVLCDDMALAVPAAGGGFRAHPLPTWSAFESGGTRWPCHANRSVTLQALFVLEQSPEDGAEPLAGAKTALIVERACGEALQPFHLFGPDSVPSLGRHVFENAASLAAEVPAFRLRVSLDGRFWEKIDEALESKAGR